MTYRPFPDRKGRNWRQQRLEIPLFTWLLRVPQHAEILEVGCGRGIGLPVIAERCRPARLVGIDFDPDLVARARSATDSVRAELLCGDVRTLPFDDCSFDVVVDFGTCYHTTAPWRALVEISRVLRVGGLFAYETPVNQLLSHPIRSGVRSLPWPAAPDLVPASNALLWAARRKRKGVTIRG